jgi:LysR family transcriptional regulator for bpeEF and oprC
MNLDKLEAMQLFLRLADMGSFSQAANASGISRATASKQLSQIEESLGTQLMLRTTRDLTLTTEGRTYYSQVRQIFEGIETTEARIEKGQTSPSGVLRVTMAPTFGRMHVVPQLRGFLEQYPDVLVDIEMSERTVNLEAEGIDLAIRIGALADSSLVAKQIGSVKDVTVGTPAFFARHGIPAHPKDSQRMPCVVCLSQGAPIPWRYHEGGARTAVEPHGRVRSNDAEYVRASVLKGLGMGHGPAWLFAEDIRAGSLVEVLGRYSAPAQAVSIVTPAGRRNPRKAQVFTEYLAQRFWNRFDTEEIPSSREARFARQTVASRR